MPESHDPLRSLFREAAGEGESRSALPPVAVIELRGERVRRRRIAGLAVATCLVLSGSGAALAAFLPGSPAPALPASTPSPLAPSSGPTPTPSTSPSPTPTTLPSSTATSSPTPPRHTTAPPGSPTGTTYPGASATSSRLPG
ncbi:hypothetical protein [Streptomyces sp. NRRL F-2580]|uniref:hypothetical protein n=1 Tax=Streptomyces sp. NRRL F-2580 TaxID=1463841 RepID=UPI0004CA3B5B|nr:hypothetical protein [Streptomyces sp. NRRL F-2580]